MNYSIDTTQLSVSSASFSSSYWWYYSTRDADSGLVSDMT